MAKGQNQVIYKSDLGKALTNGNAEVANYSVFAVTVQEKTVGSFKFTFIWSRSGSTEFGAYCHTSSNIYYIWWSITLSGNTFSCSYTTSTTLPHAPSSATTGTISQIRGIG